MRKSALAFCFFGSFHLILLYFPGECDSHNYAIYLSVLPHLARTGHFTLLLIITKHLDAVSEAHQ